MFSENVFICTRSSRDAFESDRGVLGFKEGGLIGRKLLKLQSFEGFEFELFIEAVSPILIMEA